MKNDLFINVWDYYNPEYTFNFFIGARGSGKTYSGLKGLAIDKKHVIEGADKFLFMRRTQDELDILLDNEKGESEANPFTTINRDFNTNIGLFKTKKTLATVYNKELDEETGKYHPVGVPLGIGCALTTICKYRGMNFEDISIIMYDEFIKEKHLKAIRNEHDALFNAYETINRNREIFGRPPVVLFAFANSNDIYNPIFTGLNIVRDCERMIKTGKEHKYYPDRKLAIHIFKTTETFKEAKSDTALYRLTKGTQFSEMALDNKFSYNDFSDIAHRELKGFIPLCSLDNGYLYKKKGSREMYFSYAPAKCPHYSAKNETDKRQFMRSIGASLTDYASNHLIIYESYELKTLLLDLLF